MRVNINGQIIPATVVNEGGRDVGYADMEELLLAMNPDPKRLSGSLTVPWRLGTAGRPIAAIRALGEAMGYHVRYEGHEQTIYLEATAALPELPASPVGADINPVWPVDALITSAQSARRPELLDLCIRQFHVAKNPRLIPRDGNTYCNIALWDFTRALGAEIPHWVDQQGRPARPGEPGAYELDANGVATWLERCGGSYGWWRSTPAGALEAANAGRPAVAVWFNAGGIGHVAIVRPGLADPVRGVPIAQAGATNFDDGYLLDGFGQNAAWQVRFYTHD